MKAGIVNKIIVFSYLLFALSLVILCLNKTLAIIVLAASFGTFLLGGLIRTLSENNSPLRIMKKKKGKM